MRERVRKGQTREPARRELHHSRTRRTIKPAKDVWTSSTRVMPLKRAGSSLLLAAFPSGSDRTDAVPLPVQIFTATDCLTIDRVDLRYMFVKRLGVANDGNGPKPQNEAGWQSSAPTIKGGLTETSNRSARDPSPGIERGLRMGEPGVSPGRPDEIRILRIRMLRTSSLIDALSTAAPASPYSPQPRFISTRPAKGGGFRSSGGWWAV
jgi:hypothetical protein